MKKIYFFLPDVIGGVATILTKLLEHSTFNYDLQLVTYRNSEEKRLAYEYNTEIEKKIERITYNKNDNIYFVGKKIIKKISKENSFYVATDSIELLSITICKIDVPVIFIIMGDFKHYYDLALLHKNIINRYICISKEIYNNLLTLMPDRANDIFHSYYPTSKKEFKKDVISRNNIIYVARLEEGKNPLQLIEIDNILKKEKILINWAIVGSGPLEKEFKIAVENNNATNFSFFGMITLKELDLEFNNNSIIISTSTYEGLSVSVVDAMKTGLVPVVSNIKGGIAELVQNRKNGFLCNTTNDFVDRIKSLCQNEMLYYEMSKCAKNYADDVFDPDINSNQYFELITTTPFKKGNKLFNFKSKNRLDKKWIPSILVRTLRYKKNV